MDRITVFITSNTFPFCKSCKFSADGKMQKLTIGDYIDLMRYAIIFWVRKRCHAIRHFRLWLLRAVRQHPTFLYKHRNKKLDCTQP